MRTNLGKAEDRKRTYEGPHRQKVQFYPLFFIFKLSSALSRVDTEFLVFDCGNYGKSPLNKTG